jgi:AcrR family transcriptional regulator
MATGLPEPNPRPGSAAERGHLAAAALAVVGERGFQASSSELVVERAGLGPGAFHRHFEDLRDCCSQLYAEIAEDFNRSVFDAIARSEAERWRDRLRVAAYAVARYFNQHPEEVRFGVLGLLDAGEMLQVQREQRLKPLVDLIDEARQELANPGSISRSAAESTVGSIFALLLREVREHGRVRQAESLVPELMYIAVRPYFGENVAREELSMPPPPGVEPEPVSGRQART